MTPLMLYDGSGKVVASAVVDQCVWQVNYQTFEYSNAVPVVVDYLGAEAEIIAAYEVLGLGFVMCPSQIYVSPGSSITFQKGALSFVNYPHQESEKVPGFMYTPDGQPYI